MAARDLNLTIHRASANVWNRPGWNGSPGVEDVTRWLIGAGAGLLALEGLRRRSVPGALVAAGGGALAWWTVANRADTSGIRARLNHLAAWWSGGDAVADASADSFPASDAPAWTPTTGVAGRGR